MGRRYYDPGTGRFVTRDLIGYGGGANLYGFAGNNPVNEMDPDGMNPADLLDQPVQDPTEEGLERVWQKVGPSVYRLAIRPIGTSLRIAGTTAAFSATLFFMSQGRVADDSMGPGSPYVVAKANQIIRKCWKKRVMFDGNTVYQRDDIFLPTKSNLALMRGGNAPYGADGNPIVLHHMLQTQDGPIAEVTMSFHLDNFGTLHINMPTKKFPSGIDRPAFGAWKRQYWMNRAKDFDK